jgi:hypothetical protein
VGDHFLDSVSNYILRQIQKPFAQYMPHDWDPLHFLPVNIQSHLQKSEALVSNSFSQFLFAQHDSERLTVLSKADFLFFKKIF